MRFHGHLRKCPWNLVESSPIGSSTISLGGLLHCAMVNVHEHDSGWRWNKFLFLEKNVIVSNFTNSARHVVPSMTNSQWNRVLEIFEIDFLSWKTSSLWYRQYLHATRGHLLAEWEAFWISQSLNFEHVFQGFLRQFEVGKKAGRYLDVFNMAKKFFW